MSKALPKFLRVLRYGYASWLVAGTASMGALNILGRYCGGSAPRPWCANPVVSLAMLLLALITAPTILLTAPWETLLSCLGLGRPVDPGMLTEVPLNFCGIAVALVLNLLILVGIEKIVARLTRDK